MVKSNGFVVYKVFKGIRLLSLLMILSLNAFATDQLGNGKEGWVDSIYHSLSLKQRIQQLLFPVVTSSDQVMDGLGGIITTPNLQRTEELGGIWSPLMGYMSNEFAFQIHLGLNPEILAATDNEYLFQRAGSLSGKRLAKNGFDFALVSKNQYPRSTSNQIRKEQFNDAYHLGLIEAGIGIWHEVTSKTYGLSDALSLDAYYSHYGINIEDARKKDLRKIRKYDKPTQLQLILSDMRH